MKNFATITSKCVKALMVIALAIPTTIAAPMTAQAIPVASQVMDRSLFNLTNGEWEELWQIQQRCHEITEGYRTSATFEIDATKILGKNDWTVDDYGIEPLNEDGSDINVWFEGRVNGELNSRANLMLRTIHLIAPSTIEWANRYQIPSTEIRWSWEYRDGKWHAFIISSVVNIPVSYDYRPSEEAYYEVDQSRTQTIRDSLDRAQDIATRHAGEPAPQRIRSYIKEIVNLATLKSGVMDTRAGLYPWGFISVFDGDPNTATLCEGFSKALSLLVELSGRDDMAVYSIIGASTTYQGQVRHMWSIAKMPDGNKYLIDVGNSTPKTMGSNGDLILANTSGNPEYGYDTRAGKIDVHYDYHTETMELYNYDALILTCGGYRETYVETYVAPEPEPEVPNTTYESNEPKSELTPAQQPIEETTWEAPVGATEETHEQEPLTLTSETRYITLSEEDFDQATVPMPDNQKLARIAATTTAVVLIPVAIVSILGARKRNARQVEAYSKQIHHTPTSEGM